MTRHNIKREQISDPEILRTWLNRLWSCMWELPCTAEDFCGIEDLEERIELYRCLGPLDEWTVRDFEEELQER